MKLSEAIRLGAMSAAQCRGEYLEIVKGEVLATCALFSALDAAGDLRLYRDGFSRSPLSASSITALVGMGCSRWPVLLKAVAVPAPLVAVRHWNPFGPSLACVLNIIVGLNDRLEWTREQIADWVEQIEQQHERAGDNGESLGGTPDAKGPEPTRTAATEVRFESEAPAPVPA